MSKTNQYQRFLTATGEKPVEVKTKKTVATPAPALPATPVVEPEIVESNIAVSVEDVETAIDRIAEAKAKEDENLVSTESIVPVETKKKK